MFNVDDKPAALSARWDQLGLPSGKLVPRDLWEGHRLAAADRLKIVLPAHGCVLYAVNIRRRLTVSSYTSRHVRFTKAAPKIALKLWFHDANRSLHRTSLATSSEAYASSPGPASARQTLGHPT